MKLIVPHLGELHPADARLVRLAEFLGIDCVAVSADAVESGTWASEAGVDSDDGCLVINPEVLRGCLNGSASFA